MLIQILCDKNYNCRKVANSKSTNDTSVSLDDSDSNKNQRKKKATKKPTHPHHTSIKMEKSQRNNKQRDFTEIELDESVIFGQPASFYPKKCEHTNFHTTPTNSNLQFSPSFNLEPNKKSNPIGPSNCNSCQTQTIFPKISLQNVCPSCTTVNFQNTQTQTQSQTNPAPSTPKQTNSNQSILKQTKTKADIHESPLDVSSTQNNESFQSCK